LDGEKWSGFLITFSGSRGQSPGLKLFWNRPTCEVPGGLTAVLLANKANNEYEQANKKQRQRPKSEAAPGYNLLYPRGHPLIKGMGPRRHQRGRLTARSNNFHPVTSV